MKKEGFKQKIDNWQEWCLILKQYKAKGWWGGFLGHALQWYGGEWTRNYLKVLGVLLYRERPQNKQPSWQRDSEIKTGRLREGSTRWLRQWAETVWQEHPRSSGFLPMQPISSLSIILMDGLAVLFHKKFLWFLWLFSLFMPFCWSAEYKIY